jgi:hypothetical protein
MLTNAVFKEFAEINASHHDSMINDNYSWILNTENTRYDSSGYKAEL